MTSAVAVVPHGMAILEDSPLGAVLMTMIAAEGSPLDMTIAIVAIATIALATTAATTVPPVVSTATPAARTATAEALPATTATAAVVTTAVLPANPTDTAIVRPATPVAVPLLPMPLPVDPRVAAEPMVDMMMTAVVDTTAEDKCGLFQIC